MFQKISFDSFILIIAYIIINLLLIYTTIKFIIICIYYSTLKDDTKSTMLVIVIYFQTGTLLSLIPTNYYLMFALIFGIHSDEHILRIKFFFLI